MAWCCQATSHYLSQCWPTAISLLTRPQWVKEKILPSHVLSSIIQLIWPLVVTVNTNSAGPPPHIFSTSLSPFIEIDFVKSTINCDKKMRIHPTMLITGSINSDSHPGISRSSQDGHGNADDIFQILLLEMIFHIEILLLYCVYRKPGQFIISRFSVLTRQY